MFTNKHGYERFKETTVTTKQVEEGIALDYDAAQRLDNPEALKRVVFEKGARREIEKQIATGLQSR